MNPTLPKHILAKLSEYGIEPDTLDSKLTAMLNTLDTTPRQSEEVDPDLASTLSAQNDIAFKLNPKQQVQWYKSDAHLARHIPDSLGNGGQLKEYLPRYVLKSLNPLLKTTQLNQQSNDCEIKLGTSGDHPAYYSTRILPSADGGCLILLKNTTDSRMEEQGFIASISQLESLNRSLIELNKHLHHTHDEALLDELVVNGISQAMAPDIISLWVFEENKNVLMARLSVQGPKQLPLRQSLLHRTSAPRYFDRLEHGRVTSSTDLAATAALDGIECAEIYRNTTVTVVETPIRFDGAIIGLIRLESLSAQPGWQNNEHTFIASLADLYAQAKERLRKEETERALSQSENRFKVLTENSDTAIFAFEDHFLYANPALEQFTGLNQKELINSKVESVFNEHFRARHRQAALECDPHAKSQSVKQEIEVITANAEARWLFVTSTRADFEGQPCWLASAFDITERKTSEARLKYQAYHDQLTGLPNRMRLLERIESSLSRSSRDRFYRFAVMFINIDRFKVFNDSMGQLLGDQLLLELSKRIRLCLNSSDMAARVSGDEFAVFIDNVQEKSTALNMIRVLQNAISEPMHFDAKETICSASIGVTLADFHYEKAEHIIRDASIAMYYAKQSAKDNYAFFDASMHERAKRILEMESDLRMAIRNQSLELYYQPIVSTEDKRTHYFEALIRWRKNENTLISPIDFIPLAEESGVILALGKWIIHTACQQLVTWQNAGHSHICISINVSGKQFETGEIAKEIGEALEQYSIPRRALKVEITETSMIENSHTIQEQLSELKVLGCDLLVDDFGTGYSSLSYLHKFPINCIKIDRSFIANLGTEEESIEIIRAIIHLARNLKLKVIAEGVEQAEQLAILEEFKCDYIQGYFYAKPAPAELATKMIDYDWLNPPPQAEPKQSPTTRFLNAIKRI